MMNNQQPNSLHKPMLKVREVSKTFVLHNQSGIQLSVLNHASLDVHQGECVVLHGHSGWENRPYYARYMPTIWSTVVRLK